MAKSGKPIVVLTTVAKKSQADNIAQSLLEQNLAACVTALPGGESRYRWKGKICKENEYLLIIKTASTQYDRLEKALKSIHPYECPEIMALPTDKIYPPYRKWLMEQVSKKVL
ncbi:MAG: divalent-cation tolerance protein CutA [bacterium]|nr:divalent-cation tolerance protein CutA [bacterium]